MTRLGVIGYGGRISGIVREIEKQDASAKLVAITDIRNEEIAKNMGEKASQVRFYPDAKKMLDDGGLDGVLIGTRCTLHAGYACLVARYGIPLFLEKPVATSYEDVNKLRKAFPTGKEPVVISFPLRISPLLQKVKEIVDSGRLGRIQQILAVNFVPFDSYGHAYYQYWYRDYDLMGGLFLQKATHDLDYINCLVNSRPVRLAATKSHGIFGGSKAHELLCSDCKEQEQCLESPYHRKNTWPNKPDEINPAMKCAFTTEIKNEDCGSVLIEYEDGSHAVYVQNFYTRRADGGRGATLIGYKGMLKFDWFTEKIDIIMHHTPEKEMIDCKSEHGHHGGDAELVKDFLAMIKDRTPTRSPIHAGILSAYMCLCARESAETHLYMDLTDTRAG